MSSLSCFFMSQKNNRFSSCLLWKLSPECDAFPTSLKEIN
ncbi:conserved hypothetical protein [Vibrio parahaemolyticus Peru-466]|nr:conserved hypothetical protein [Vibrio parahaemolyticus Peru-466]EFO42577.1 conserved hypothetical protein [Vibrio parahaemolyticus AN-5034]EFO44201.1 hypothetical protein VIPARAQ4037_0268 [Vibrio parahaemolyticus AQ4037]EFO50250.1 conserved hypothetical protein [Vibrio parahaemolyticus K5030]EQL86709.1 hypothetical protein D036_4256 [Vibrio parahaemolyticus VP232]EQL95897.1 hypothetical protein D035_2327 [Vibrio parahaemolyticus VP250]EQM05091.1 hypothetical protein D045_4539 [Vibrio para